MPYDPLAGSAVTSALAIGGANAMGGYGYTGEIGAAASALLASMPAGYGRIRAILTQLVNNPTNAQLVQAIGTLRGHAGMPSPPVAKHVAATVAKQLQKLLASVIRTSHSGYPHPQPVQGQSGYGPNEISGASPMPPLPPIHAHPAIAAAAQAQLANLPPHHPLIEAVLNDVIASPNWPTYHAALSILRDAAQGQGPLASLAAPTDRTLAIAVATALQQAVSHGGISPLTA